MTINKLSLPAKGNAVQLKINEIIDNLGGGGTDVQINGTSITSSGVADIKTNGTYNASSNKIATMSDLPTVPTKVSDLTNDSGYITGINSSDVTTALGYTPTSPANVDGQWVASIKNDFTVSPSKTTSPQEFNLKTLNYLPNDNNKYEVLVWLEASAGTGNASVVYLSSDIVSGNCIAVQRSESKFGDMNLSIPVTSTLKVQVTLANVGSVTLAVLGYRRIGTNS